MNWRDEKRMRRHEFVTRRDEDFVQDLTAYRSLGENNDYNDNNRKNNSLNLRKEKVKVITYCGL